MGSSSAASSCRAGTRDTDTSAIISQLDALEIRLDDVARAVGVVGDLIEHELKQRLAGLVRSQSCFLSASCGHHTMFGGLSYFKTILVRLRILKYWS